MSGLNTKYKKVIDRWFALGCKDGANIDAWIEFSDTNNRDSAAVGWNRMLKNVKVQEYIKERKEENQERLLIEYGVGMGDIFKELKQIGVDGINEWLGVPQAVKTTDKLKALDMLIQIIGGYAPEKKEVRSSIEVDISELPIEQQEAILKKTFDSN